MSERERRTARVDTPQEVRRQLIRRQSALASTASAALGALLGTGCRRGRPVEAVGQCNSTVGG